MNCTQSNEFMMKQFDGILNDLEGAQFKQHLKTCRKCEEEFESMQSILAALAVECPEPPEDFESKVMERVNIIAEEKKKKASKWLVVLYNITTLVSMALLLLYAANLRDISIVSGIKGLGHYFTSLSGIVAGLYEITAGIYGLVVNAIGIIFHVFLTLLKTYYYVFIALLVVLVGMQKLFFVLVDQGREGNE